MKTNIIIDISAPIPYPPKLLVFRFGPRCCQPIKLQGSLKCNISKKVNNEVYFWYGDKHQNLLQVDYHFGCPKYPKQQVYNIFAIPQGKKG